MTLRVWPWGRPSIRHCCIRKGTFVDDVIVHRLGEDEYLLVINAGTREKDFNWVRDNTRQFDCVVENLSDDFTQIAIQGPRAVDLLQKMTAADLSAVKFYWVTRGNIVLVDKSMRRYLAKHSYRSHRIHCRGWIRDLCSFRRTYERLGLEQNSRSRQGIPASSPCGLALATLCASKAVYPSTATRFPDTINVWEAGLDRFCKMDKPEFIRSRRFGKGES